MTYMPRIPKKWFLFAQCTNCFAWNFRRNIKRQKIYVTQIKQIVTGQKEICNKCRKLVEAAIKQRNI